MDIKDFAVEEGDTAVFLNRRCEHRITKLETLNVEKEEIYERKMLAFFIIDPEKSNIPNSKNMIINKNLSKEEIDASYLRKKIFKNSRFVDKCEELDYSETENDEVIKSISEKFQVEKNDADQNSRREFLMINIKTLTGKFFPIYAYSDDSVKMLKTLIIEETGNYNARLIFEGKQLDEDRKISDYNIVNNSIVHLIIRLSGD